MLLWYTKLQEIIKKKPCESPEAMFTLTELLLVGQGQSTFKECQREVCENPVSSTDPKIRGITDESYTMAIGKFKAKAFKKFAAKRQVSYLHNNIRKPLVVSIRTCSTHLTEMNNYLRLFPGPDSNIPLGEGDLIDILVRMVPTAWRESSHLSKNKQNKIINLLKKYEELFNGTLGDMNTSPVHLEIKKGAIPKHHKPFPVPKVHEMTLPYFRYGWLIIK